jgi:hypothetical protein
VAYPLHELRTEVAFIAYHFHWALDAILDLPHRERVAWVGHISTINQRIMDQAQA